MADPTRLTPAENFLRQIQKTIPIPWPSDPEYWAELKRYLAPLRLTSLETAELKRRLLSRPITWPRELVPRLELELANIRENARTPKVGPAAYARHDHDPALEHWGRMTEDDRAYWVDHAIRRPDIQKRLNDSKGSNFWLGVAEGVAMSLAYKYACGKYDPKTRQQICPTPPTETSDSNDTKPCAVP